MKFTKKFLALLLVVALVISGSSIYAFASEMPEETVTPLFEEVETYELTDFSSDSVLSTVADSSIIYQFELGGWCPATAYSQKRQAQKSGTMRIGIAAACIDPEIRHTNDKIQVKVTSGIVTLATITVPADGKLHVYRFNGSDQKKVNIVKGNNYTTTFSSASPSNNCLMLAVSGYVGVE